MLEYWYKEKRTLVDFRRGPLGPHFDGFAARLKAEDYSPDGAKTVLNKKWAAATASVWAVGVLLNILTQFGGHREEHPGRWSWQGGVSGWVIAASRPARCACSGIVVR